MRFGKKLALQVMEDNSGAPYLSHKPMKEAINRTVRELRLYQAREQGNELPQWHSSGADGCGAAAGSTGASQEELAAIEARIAALDGQLFALVDEDLARIRQHVRLGEARLQGLLAAFQRRLLDSGLLMEEAQLMRLEKLLPQGGDARGTLFQRVLELRLRSDPRRAGQDLQDLTEECNIVLDVAAQHAQYMEINVAGFRKLLKRHEKQIPQRFRSRAMPCLGFHRLVTRASRALLELTLQLRELLADARQRLSSLLPPARLAELLPGGAWLELQEFRGLGPECEMVLNIQRQLKDPLQVTAAAAGDDAAVQPACLYPKPNSGPVRTGPVQSSTNRGAAPPGALSQPPGQHQPRPPQQQQQQPQPQRRRPQHQQQQQQQQQQQPRGAPKPFTVGVHLDAALRQDTMWGGYPVATS